MPWLIRTKGRLLDTRDGRGPGRPLYVIDGSRWFPFEQLPPGTDPEHDGDLVCREVSEEEAAKHEKAPLHAEVERKRREELARSRPEPKTEEPKPPKRKSRMR
jgi:hypothetical protein